MIDQDTLKRYRFHREWGGGIVGESALWALRSARAERLLDDARDLGCAAVQWLWDDQPYDCDGLTAEQIQAKFDSNEWTGPLGCVLWVSDEVDSLDEDALNEADRDPERWSGNASLWGIVVGPRGTDDPYCRVVVADLALEVEDDLRQAIGDAKDARRDADCGICRLLPYGACDWHVHNPA